MVLLPETLALKVQLIELMLVVVEPIEGQLVRVGALVRERHFVRGQPLA